MALVLSDELYSTSTKDNRTFFRMALTFHTWADLMVPSKFLIVRGLDGGYVGLLVKRATRLQERSSDRGSYAQLGCPWDFVAT